MLSFIGDNFLLLAFGALLVFTAILGSVSIVDGLDRPSSD